MSDFVLLVCLPRNPLTFEVLRPRSDVANLAAALRALGADAHICDLGSLERIPTLLSPEVLNALPATDNLSHIDFSQRGFAPLYLAEVTNSIRHVYAETQPNATLFLADSPFERRIARTLSLEWPRPNTYLLADGEISPLTPQQGLLTDLLTEANSRASRIGGEYSPDVYPALRHETKLRVFEIGTNTSTGDSVSGLFTILEETAALHRHYGTRAFHLGRSVAGNQLYHLASELVTRNSRFQYSVNAAMADYPAELATIAAASGCVAASFQVGSGSQRLLEEHYSYGFKLHSAERTVRRFAEAGIHTRVELTYPCAKDDFHTRDETLRFVGRCLPHSVQVNAPPDSARPITSALWKPTERRRRSLERALHNSGAAPDIGPVDALLASLAGFAGRERQFRNHAARALVTGNVDALAALVETINANAAGRSDAFFWKSFGADERMVGN